ncbi:hypothetical protein Nepgr_009171 [Nepenthes gracilis]|uniref:Uncharacterized protein n=1 Tax=Nepenthes gracilis TaxID=150966 RepID=A0AAD3SAG7_NEPGR|nr:hypothetical protein Nepgr_009171 [Nepenthes gracilis]
MRSSRAIAILRLQGYSCTLLVFHILIRRFKSFIWIAVSYQLKDVLKLSPSASQFVFSIAFFPWSIKPIYGILSDCIPIRGRRRIPYIVIATVLSLLSWLVLGLNASLRTLSLPLMIFLTLQNIGFAMANVVVDAMIAEVVRFERTKFAVGVCGNFLGGYPLSNLRIDTIFQLFVIILSLQLISCGFVEENPVSTKVSSDVFDLTSSQFKNENSNAVHEDNFLVDKPKIGTLRRTKSLKSSEK